MTSSETWALLVRENPVREEELPSARGAEARALKERIVQTEIPATPAGRQPRRSQRGWLVLAAAAVLAAVLTLPQVLPDERIGASPAAAAVLERAAVAATAYSSSGGEGRYAYTRAETLYAAIRADAPPYSVLIPSVRETWVAADGSGRLVETRGEPVFLGERDRARWLAAGSPPLVGSSNPIDERVRAHYQPVPPEVVAMDPEDLDPRQLDQLLSAVPQLPTEPGRLERIIRAYSETKDPPFEAQMFNQISDLLHSPYGSAELRAAAYRVLARLEGVELGGRRRDSAGRLGTAISAPAGYGGPDESTPNPEDSTLNANERRLVIIDPESGNVLAEETVLTRRVDWIDGTPGEVTGAITILEQGWVDSLERRPDGRG
jgi:hypothetical protein